MIVIDRRSLAALPINVETEFFAIMKSSRLRGKLENNLAISGTFRESLSSFKREKFLL